MGRRVRILGALFSLVLVALLVVSCDSQSVGPTSSDRGGDETPSSPQTDISDGAHMDGNAEFFFLPPLVPDPSGDPDFDEGAFRGDFLPFVTVEIRHLSDCQTYDETGTLLTTFTSTTGPGSETVRVDLQAEHYIANWHVGDFTEVSDGDCFRVAALVGGQELGFADVEIVDKVGGKGKNQNTGDDISLKDGRTLPIKFRVEENALCEGNGPCESQVITDANGGQVVLLDDQGDPIGGIDFEPNSLPDGQDAVVVTVEVAPLDQGEACLEIGGLPVGLPQFGECLLITTDPPLAGELDPPATVGVCIELPNTGLSGVQQDLLQIHRFDEDTGETTALPNTSTDICNAPSALGPALEGPFEFAQAGWRLFQENVLFWMDPPPLYAGDLGLGGFTRSTSRFKWALPAKMEILGGNNQVEATGSTVDPDPTVLVIDQNGDPVAGATVALAVEATAEAVGSVTPASVTTGGDGRASGTWTLGASAGTNQLTFTGTGIANPLVDAPAPFADNVDPRDPVKLGTGTLTFTAEGVASDPCTGSGPCTSEIVTDADGGVVVVRDETTGEPIGGIDIPAGALPEGPDEPDEVVVTVEVFDESAEACLQVGGLPVGLPQFGECLRITTDPVLTQDFESDATVGICIDLPNTGLSAAQQDLLQIHRFDEDLEQTFALPNTSTGICDLPVVTQNTEMDGVLDYAQAGWRLFQENVLFWVDPPALHAGDLGLGGFTRSTSRFKWALPAKMEILEGNNETEPAGASVDPPPTVLVTDRDGTAVANATLSFAVTAGGGSVSPGQVTTGTAGTASPTWTLGTTGGTNTLGAEGVGIADPADNGPFADHAGAEVQLEVGELTFTAQAQAAPDLVISSGTPTVTPTTVEPGGTVDLSAWDITNQGAGDVVTADGDISNGFYLSTDATLTTADVRLDGNSNTDDVLEAGETFNWGGPTLTIPSGTAPGDYFIGILVDELDEAAESDETNNFESAPLAVCDPGAAGSAVIDGVLCGVEWDGATTFGPFTVDLPNGSTARADVWLMNDDTDLFLAVQFDQDLSSFSLHTVAARLDEDGNGAWDDGPDQAGEDGFVVQHTTFGNRVDAFIDEYFDTSLNQGQRDDQNGGSNDGGTAIVNNTTTTIETSHPLNSGDLLDAAFTSGDSYRLLLFTNVGDGTSTVRTDLVKFSDALLNIQ